MNFSKVNLVMFLFLFTANTLFAQSNFDSTKYSPVVLDGKEAYLEIETGKIFYGDHARSEVYKEQLDNNSTSETSSVGSVSSSFSENRYLVVKGDTLYAIARKYGLRPAYLARINQISLNAPLRVGQVLTVRAVENTNLSLDTSAVSSSHYQVKKGDTLYSIAKIYGITVYELKQLNNLSGNAIYIHQELKIR